MIFVYPSVRQSVSGDDRCFAPIELVVEAHFENVLVGAHVQRAGDAARGAAKSSRHAGCPEADVLGTKTQIIVFELGSPVIEEGIFQTKTDQQTIQRGAPLRGRANESALYFRRVPVKSAGYPSRFAVNKCPVKGDAKSPGN